jgi:phage terminase large subunit GpA-like protein
MPLTHPRPLPEDVLLLTAGADVQAGYCTVLTVGWALDGQLWVLDWQEIEGSPFDGATFTELLRRVSTARWPHPLFIELPITYLAIDSGFATSNVYAAVRLTRTPTEPRPPWVRDERWVMATKGEPGAPGDPAIYPKKDRRHQHTRLNTYALTTEWLARLQLPAGAPNSVHLPKWITSTDLLKQFTAEELKPIYNADGVEVERRFVQVYAKNEGLDCAKGNLAIWHTLRGGPRGRDLLFPILVRRLGDQEEAIRLWRACHPHDVRF